ncbi:MAG: AraC family transcriptional regulator [Caulobacteraceae bacterium]|nr:AraC family transcriptional regulator [Caulobacteraceae bacterium]
MGQQSRHVDLEFEGAGASEAWAMLVADHNLSPPFRRLGPDGGFTGRYADQRWGDARIIDVRLSPMILTDRDPGQGGAVLDDYLVQVFVEGRATYYPAGAFGYALKPGQVILRPAANGTEIRADRAARIVTIVLPVHHLAPRFARRDALVALNGPLEAGLSSRLIGGLVMGQMDGEAASAARPEGFIDALAGLVALAVAQTPPPPTPLSELAASRAADIQAYLRRNFANSQLTPAMMAEDLGISVRYAHKLMRMTGQSFRETLIRQRLDAARVAFAASRRPRETIAEIAIAVGFNDISQFNRHFRAAYGLTPRAARRLDEITGYPPLGAGFAPRDGETAPFSSRLVDIADPG